MSWGQMLVKEPAVGITEEGPQQELGRGASSTDSGPPPQRAALPHQVRRPQGLGLGALAAWGDPSKPSSYLLHGTWYL